MKDLLKLEDIVRKILTDDEKTRENGGSVRWGSIEIYK